jgi:membrane protein required for colicin V production
MNFLDFIILAALGYAAWIGFKKGFIIELFTFLALFMGLYAGIHFSDWLTSLLRDQLGFTSEYLPAISFTLIFLGIGAMVYFAGKALEKVIKVVQLNLLNKLLGIFFSMLKMIFFIGAGILLLESYNQKGKLISPETREGSFLYRATRATVTACIPAFEESTLMLESFLLDDVEDGDANETLPEGEEIPAN